MFQLMHERPRNSSAVCSPAGPEPIWYGCYQQPLIDANDKLTKCVLSLKEPLRAS